MKRDRYISKRNKKLTLELLVRIFYALDLNPEDLITLKDSLKSTSRLAKHYKNQIDDIVSFYQNNSLFIDQLIASHLIGWRFERLGKIEKAVLRVGTTYILYLKEKHPLETYQREIRYIISFLLEILECYGGNKESIKFVNGILGRIFREQTGQIQVISSV